MPRTTIIAIVCLCIGTGIGWTARRFASEPHEGLQGQVGQRTTSLMEQASTLTRQLAFKGGFSDIDAKEVAVFLLEKLIGPKAPKERLICEIVSSKPEFVGVFAGYDDGLVCSGYEIEFTRGGSGSRSADFYSLKVVPGM